MAAAGALSKTCPDAAGPPGRDPELLPHQSTFRYGGSHQRQHQNPSSKGPRLHQSRLSAPEGSAHGGHKVRIHRSSESSLKCGSLRILVQNRFSLPTSVMSFFPGPPGLRVDRGCANDLVINFGSFEGKTSLLYSMHWTRILRPTQFAISRLCKRKGLSSLRMLMRCGK